MQAVKPQSSASECMSTQSKIVVQARFSHLSAAASAASGLPLASSAATAASFAAPASCRTRNAVALRRNRTV